MDAISEAREVALRYLDYAPRTGAEVRRRLERGGFDEDVVETVLADLEQAGFVNDAKLCRDWVESRTQNKGLGRVRLAEELRRKGIDREIVDEVVEEIDPDEELETALNLVRKRTTPEELEDMVVRRKIAGYLQRRGYKWELIEQVFAKLMAK